MAPPPEPYLKGNDHSMEFSFDVVPDVQSDLEDFTRESTLGFFGEAQNIYQAGLKEYEHYFPIFADYLRVLYDGGAFEALRASTWQSTEDAAGHQDIHQRTPIQMKIVRFFNYCADMEGCVASSATNCNVHIEEVTEAIQSLDEKAIDTLSEEQLLLLVLALRIRFLEHQILQQPSKEAFSCFGMQLHEITEYLLRDERYWAAEKVLEMCFRRTTHQVHHPEAWKSIEWFVTVTSPEDNEQELLAKISLLQTFCAGLLYWETLQINSHCSECRTLSSRTAPDIIDSLTPRMELLVGPAVWKMSRASLRQRLITTNRRILSNPMSGQNAAFVSLWQLGDDAERNQDWRLLSRVQQIEHILRVYRLTKRVTYDISTAVDIGDRLCAAARSLEQLQFGQELKPAYGRYAVQIKAVEREFLRHAASARASTERDERIEKAAQNIAKQIERCLANAKDDAETFEEAEEGSDATRVLSPPVELGQAPPALADTCRALDKINSSYRSRVDLDQGAVKVAPWSVYAPDALEDLLAEICKRIQEMEKKYPALGNDSERQAEEDLSQIGASDITVFQTLRDLTEGIDLALWNEATKKLKATGRHEFRDIETKDHAKAQFGDKYRAEHAGSGHGSTYTKMVIGGNSDIHAGNSYLG